ncbi:AfsR/SARP family transcriptional regulator [Streptomyces capillispiralis]|uniref:DNA-binding SARP family transcriptional activator n=1 Tax=Streptomyces capillispiralis TaxID=68182 RepID=A0A561SGT9_9ACTN|nr:BTAD domain-containing putative transcriptional regulator [Streptomyces capillispiralis]TWF74086.1 DNA-binding SARP family transcriptional activator [Streptomyces capillispiralis]GHH96406.1 regulatory protein AfsR [Streptomyces capillispiralis]
MDSDAVRFCVLGPVKAWRGDTEVRLGSPQQRVVMASLLIRRGAYVSSVGLVDAVWGPRPPASATNALRVYVHRLRRAIGPVGEGGPSIESIGSGYRLHVVPQALDLAVFRTVLTRAQDLQREGDHKTAGQVLRSALAQWQGQCLADLPGVWAQTQRARLGNLRLDALDALFTSELCVGSHQGLITELTGVAEEYPFEERFRELLMLALYRSGRQASALAVYEETRELLARELGIGPSPTLGLLHQQILRADPALLADAPALAEKHLVRPQQVSTVRMTPPAEPPAPTRLPREPSGFIGRQKEQALFREMAQAARSTAWTGGVCLVTGAAGVGKSAFAVRMAHQLSAHYPDGSIHVDLHGYGPAAPLLPEQVLDTVLRAFGVDTARVPARTEARAALYRSVLAGKRALLLFDNAVDARQLRRLLPGASPSLVVATSRNHLADLVQDGARHLRLEALPEQDARALLRSRLGVPRTVREKEAEGRLVTLGHRLPTALGRTAAQAATRKDVLLTHLADELTDAASPLYWFGQEGEGADPRTLLSWSYRTLTPQAARLFRLMTLAPASHLSPGAVAALTGVRLSQARLLLEELAAIHLVEEPAPGRFVLTGLPRAYAADLLKESADGHDSRRAAARLSTYHAVTSHRTASGWGTELPAAPPAVSSRAASGADGGGGRCGTTGEGCPRIVPAQDTPHILTRSTDPAEQARAHQDTGLNYLQVGRPCEARYHLVRALAAFSDLGELLETARCHEYLALVALRRGKVTQAIPHAQAAANHLAGTRDRPALAGALRRLAGLWELSGRLTEASRCHRSAITVLRELADTPAEAAAWNALGCVHHRLGDRSEAVRCYRRARELEQRAGAVRAAEDLVRRGEEEHARGDVWAAQESWIVALAVLDEYDRRAAALALGRMERLLGEHADAPFRSS